MKKNNYERIKKYESSTLIKGVNAILSKYDTEALDIKTWSELLLKHGKEFDKETEINRRHPAMDDVKIYRKQCKKLLGVIMTQSSALERIQIDSISSHRIKVLNFLKPYRRDIGTNSYKKVDEIVSLIIRLIDEDASLRLSIAEVGMKVYFDELKVIQEKLIACQSTIVQFKSEIPKTRAIEIKKSAVKTLNNLIESIELGKIKHPELDTTSLTNELESFLSEFRSLDKTRRTIAKKTAENKKTVASSPTTSATAS